MYYGGESNVPGAPGNLLAGGPSFDIPRGPGALGGRSEEQIRRLQQSMPENRQLLEEMQRRGITPGGGPQLPLAGIPGSSNLPGAVGNMAGVANATFFEGPQLNQPGNMASILPPAMSQGELYRAIQERGGAGEGTKEYGELRDLQKEWIQRQKLKGADASEPPTGFQAKYVS